MANKDFDGQVFKDYDALRRILPSQNGGVVIIKEEQGLKVKGAVMTAEDGNYQRDLELAKIGAQMLCSGQEVEIIMV
ncbi:MAG: hypothetical protein U9R14_03310 [Patescibacteria group bacterium]|nr:hypothetical protein [Patescibacteria group bacterium]